MLQGLTVRYLAVDKENMITWLVIPWSATTSTSDCVLTIVFEQLYTH